MNRKLLHFIKKYLKWIFSIALFSYGVWVFFLLLYANLIFVDSSVVNSALPERAKVDPSGFRVSFAASTLDSFLFFLLIGLISLLYSLKKPEEELFKKKLEYLFPSVDPDSKLHLHLREAVGALACVGSYSKRTIILQDLTPCKRYVKTVVKSENKIRNIHNNDLYANDDMSYGLSAEQVEFETDVLGEVSCVRVTVPNRKKEQLLYELKTIEKLTKAKPSFKSKFRVHLEPHEEALYNTVSWIWNLLGQEKMNFAMSRFTELESFEIFNEINSKVKVEIFIPPSKSSLYADLKNKIRYRTRVLDSGQSMKIESLDRTPNDKLSFLFTLQDD